MNPGARSLTALLGGILVGTAIWAPDFAQRPALAMLGCAALVGLVFLAQKRRQIARRIGRRCLGYADAVDAREAAERRWQASIEAARLNRELDEVSR